MLIRKQDLGFEPTISQKIKHVANSAKNFIQGKDKVDAANDIWQKGTYGNKSGRPTALYEAGYNPNKVQEVVNKGAAEVKKMYDDKKKTVFAGFGQKNYSELEKTLKKAFQKGYECAQKEYADGILNGFNANKPAGPLGFGADWKLPEPEKHDYQKEVASKVKDQNDKAKALEDSYNKAAQDIWSGKWGNGHEARMAKAKELGLDYNKLKARVNKVAPKVEAKPITVEPKVETVIEPKVAEVVEPKKVIETKPMETKIESIVKPVSLVEKPKEEISINEPKPLTVEQAKMNLRQARRDRRAARLQAKADKLSAQAQSLKTV